MALNAVPRCLITVVECQNSLVLRLYLGHHVLDVLNKSVNLVIVMLKWLVPIQHARFAHAYSQQSRPSHHIARLPVLGPCHR
jgi:hypothetical protein